MYFIIVIQDRNVDVFLLQVEFSICFSFILKFIYLSCAFLTHARYIRHFESENYRGIQYALSKG